MSTNRTTEPTTKQVSPWRLRYGLLIAVALAAVIVVAGMLLLTPEGRTTNLSTSTPDLSAACAPVSADALRALNTAFSARVTSVENGTVRMETLERFKGDVGEFVEFTPLSSDDSGPDFITGETYLVAVSDGVLQSCGLTGLDSPELRSLYGSAFRS